MQTRRDFMAEAAAWTVTGAAAFWSQSSARGQGDQDPVRQFLAPYVLKPETIDRFLV
ncbi:MAG: twin-arginine translocation signal domain-containing protein [Planctomycetota bacterium]